MIYYTKVQPYSYVKTKLNIISSFLYIMVTNKEPLNYCNVALFLSKKIAKV